MTTAPGRSGEAPVTVLDDAIAAAPIDPSPADPPPEARGSHDFFPLPSRVAALDALLAGMDAGEAVVLLTGENGLGKTNLLDAAFARSSPGSHVLRLGNPLSSPLTLGRLLFQFGSSEQEASGGNELDAVFRALRAGRGSEDHVIIVVEEAETLDAQALSFLGLLPTLPAVGLPRMQLLLAGRPSLLALLAQEQFQALRARIGVHAAIEPLGTEEATRYAEYRAQRRHVGQDWTGPDRIAEIVAQAGGDPGRIDTLLAEVTATADMASGDAKAELPGIGVDTADDHPRSKEAAPDPVLPARNGVRPGRVRVRVLAGAALCLGAIVAVIVLAGNGSEKPLPGQVAASEPSASSNAPPPRAERPEAAAAAGDTGAAAPSVPPAAASDQQQAAEREAAAERDAAESAQARLRREFDAFLDRQGGTPALLTATQRNELFQEYLAWRERGGRVPSPPGAAAAERPDARGR